MKKFLAMTLAVVMALSFSVTAFATDTNLPSTSGINVPVTIKAPVIKVTINDDSAITVNPYKLKVTLSDSTETNNSVIASTALITNKGDSNVKITATPSLKLEESASTVQILSSSTAKTSQTGKWIYLVMQLVNLSSADEAPNISDDSTGTGACVVLKDTETPNTATLVLDAATTTDGTTTNTYGAMGFAGDAGDNGTDVWSASVDAMTLTVIFDVAPTSENAPTP